MNKMNFNDFQMVYQNLTYAFAGGVFLCIVMMTVMFLYIMNLRKRNSNSRNSLANKVCGNNTVSNIAIDIENAMSESGRTSTSSVSIKSLNKKIHSIKRNQKSDRMEYYSKTGMPIGPLSALNIGTCNSVKIHENELLQQQQLTGHHVNHQHFGNNRTRAKLLPGLGCLPDIKIHLSRGCGASSKSFNFNLKRLSCKKRLIEELQNNGEFSSDNNNNTISNLKNSNRSIKSSKALSKVMKRTELQNTNKKPTQKSKKRMILGSISIGSSSSENKLKSGSKTILGSTKSSPAINPGFIIVDKNNQDCSISGHPNNRHNRKSRKSIRSQNSVVCNLHLGFTNDHHHNNNQQNTYLGAGNSFNFLQNINRSVKSNLSQNSQSILPSEIASFSAENQSTGMPKLHSLQSLDQFSEDSGFINNIVEQLQTTNKSSCHRNSNNNNNISTECSKSFGIKSFSFKKSTKSNRSNSSQNTNTNFSLGQATCHSNMSPISVYQNRNHGQLPPIGSSNILQDDFDQAHLENIEVGNRRDMSISPPCSSYQSYGSSINQHQPLNQKDSSTSNNSQNINSFHRTNIEPPKLVSIGYNPASKSNNNNSNSILKFNRYGSKIYQENSNAGRLELGYGSLSNHKVTLSGVQSVPLQTQFEKSIVYSSKETLDSIEENENQGANNNNNNNKEKRSSPISFKPFSTKYVKNKLSEKFSRESKDSGITVSTNLSSTSDLNSVNQKPPQPIIKKKLTATNSCGHTLVASYGANNRQTEMLGTTLDVNNLKKFKSEKVTHNKKKLEATNSIGELLKNSPRPQVNHGFLTFDNFTGSSSACQKSLYASSSTLNTNTSSYGTHAPLTAKNSLIPIDNFSSCEENQPKGLSINCNSNLTLDDLKSQIKRNSCMYQRKMSIACGASPVPAAVTKARLKPLSSLPPLGTPLMSPKFV